MQNEEADRQVREAVRMRQLELNNNSQFDLVNGAPRNVPVVPQHQMYNPGYQPAPGDFAGRPMRVNSN